MKKITLINLLVMLFLFSCQKSELENIESINASEAINPYKINVDEAKNIALNFMQEFQNSSAASTTRSVGIEVDNIEVIKVNEATTRSIGIENGMDTLIYAVNFSNNGGYALIGADRRTEPIFGIIDSGSFSNDGIVSNPNLAYFLNAALGKVIYDIKQDDSIKIVDTKSINDYENVYSTSYRLTSKWGQGTPYNQYCPGPFTGCVATAIAQVLLYFPVINSVNWLDGSSYGSSVLHWSQIQNDCFNNAGRLYTYDTPQSANEIAHLMRFLGVTFDAEYKSDGTSIESEDAINWLNKFTPIKATSLKGYNANEIFLATSGLSNKLVYMRGNSGKSTFLGITIGYTGGHAWLADGAFTAKRKSDGKLVNLYHFNWGWDGKHNGYFLANVFDTNNPAIYDSEDNTGTPVNFRYNIEYSILEGPNSSGGGGGIMF